MPAESIVLGFIRKLEEQRGEEADLFQGAFGAQVSKEYLPREGSRAPGGAEEQGGLVAIPTVSPGMAGV